jgi:hypothetical protein
MRTQRPARIGSLVRIRLDSQAMESFTPAVLAPIFFLMAFPLFWCAVVWLLAQIGGWARLGQHYATHQTPHGVPFRWQSGMVGWVSYRGVLQIDAANEGMYLSMPWSPAAAHSLGRGAGCARATAVLDALHALPCRVAAAREPAAAGQGVRRRRCGARGAEVEVGLRSVAGRRAGSSPCDAAEYRFRAAVGFSPSSGRVRFAARSPAANSCNASSSPVPRAAAARPR